MNRKNRQAAAKRGKTRSVSAPTDGMLETTVVDLMAEARWHFQQGQHVKAQDICHQILVHKPFHVHCLNLLGLIAQASGHHRHAINFLKKAIASDELNAACHYNIASSYQALNLRDKAAVHFKNAIALGLNDKDIEQFIFHNPEIVACVERAEAKWPLPIRNEEMFGAAGIEAFARDIFLQCAMKSAPICGLALEIFLTHVRSALLRVAIPIALKSRTIDENIISFSCAVAQQCFINEYVFAQSDEEAQLAIQLRNSLVERIAAGSEVPPLMLAAVAAYFPLHSLPMAETFLAINWPETVTDLLRQQIREPLEEMRDRKAIPALTSVEDSISLQVMQQYSENPYPRWTINPLAVISGELKRQAGESGGGQQHPDMDILVAGCGTGQHAFQVVQYFPGARVLAVDISLASLAYARRKSREEGLRNIEYAQGDILKLETINRTFDRIEAVGVLHHLANPKVGWRVLISLLRPGGKMRIGLYSETARRSVVEARAFIAERGYRATDENIRKVRQEILLSRDVRSWKTITTAADFYSMSGCRDLLFNVMERRFTIPDIMALLNEYELTFLGFELKPWVIEKFQQQFPGIDALTNLNHWHVFEAANPQTFWSMYVFSVCKDSRHSLAS